MTETTSMTSTTSMNFAKPMNMKRALDKLRFELTLYGFFSKEETDLIISMSGGRGLQMEVSMMSEVVHLKIHHF